VIGHPAFLFPLGLIVGLIGSLMGVGGGFLVVPLLIRGMDFEPKAATAASLGIVFLSALSGTFANVKRKRIDYRTGVILALGTLPGAWLGRIVIRAIPPQAFAYSFGGLLIGVALYVFFVKLKTGQGLLRGTPREVTDSEGQVHRYEANWPVGFAVSLGIGVISSLFGIGGGIVLVPFLVLVYAMPQVCATAVAQFTFLFASAMGVAKAVLDHQMTDAGWRVIALLGIGVIVGAHLGVAVAKKLPERAFRAMLSALIVGVAATMFWKRA
jgi:uncharacterized membrane protein YfcA